MLSDLERKLLRVLSNYKLRTGRIPAKQDLERMIGRKFGVIERGLKNLEEHEYISWSDPADLNSLVILEAWDRDQPAVPKPRPSSGIDYWTHY